MVSVNPHVLSILCSALNSPADQDLWKFIFGLPAYCEWLILYASHGFVYCDPLDSHESKSQRNQRKLFTTILLALLFFLPFSLPNYASYVIYYFSFPHPVLLTIGIGRATLKSSINRLLYFFVGRKKRGKDQPRASYKIALQRVFKDEQQGSLEEQQAAKEELS
ncbi:hypothetical protein Chor_002602 [Crotalus horridus]